MNNIILHGLKSNYKSLIGWIIGIVVWSILMLSMFPAFIDAGDQILKLIEGTSEGELIFEVNDKTIIIK